MLVTEERVRQLHVELIDDRGCLQELHHFCGLLVEHLFDEEIGYYTLGSGKASDERGWVVGVVLQRQRCQLDPGQPSLGPCGQGMHVGAGKIEAVVLHEGADVLLFQPEVSIPDLSQLAPGPPTLDRQNGIDAGPDHDMRGRGEPLDKGGEPAKSGGSDDVQVIEDEPRGASPQSQLVDQRSHDVSDVVGTLDEKVERIGGGLLARRRRAQRQRTSRTGARHGPTDRTRAKRTEPQVALRPRTTAARFSPRLGCRPPTCRETARPHPGG